MIMNTIWEVFEKSANEHGNKPAFSMGSKTYTFAQWYKNAEKVKQDWEGKPWQTILLFMPFGFSFLSNLLGLLGAKQGTVIPALYVGFPKLKILFRTMGIAHILTTPFYGLIRMILLPNIKGIGLQEEIKLLQHTPTMLVSTSGTTGLPKIGFRNDAHLLAMFKALSSNINWEDCNGHLTWFPMVTLLNAGQGVHTIYPEKFLGKYNFETLRNQVLNKKITHVSGPPTPLLDLVKTGSMPTVKQVFVGGAIITESVAISLMAGFPKAEIYTIYGSTEVEPVSVSPISLYMKLLSTGNAGVPIGVIDQELEFKLNQIGTISLKNGTQTVVGELLIKGPQAAKAISLESIGKVADDDWVSMGDMGYFDEENNFWLLGRKGFMFNSSIGKVGPFAIECPAPPNPVWQGKMTVIPYKGKVTMVLARELLFDFSPILKWCEALGIITQETLTIRKMPKDKRHNSRIDYNEIVRVLNES